MNTVLYYVMKYRAAVIGFIALIAVALLIFNVLIFRVYEYEPDQNNVPTSARIIRVGFTQPIKQIGTITLDGAEVNQEQIELDGRSVIITLTENLTDGRLTTLELKDIDSQWFGASIKTVTTQFTPKYIPYDRLSDEQKRAAVSASDSDQSDDPFLNNSFPLRGEGYSIEASKATAGTQIFVSVTFYKDIPDYDVSETAVGMSDQEAEAARTKALKTIKDKGGSPDKYVIRYSNSYLNQKYGAADAEEWSVD
jgi:hypothetical protein